MESLQQILIRRGWVQRAQLRRAVEAQRSLGHTLGTNLLELGAVSEERLGQALSEHFGVPCPEVDALRRVPEEVWRRLPEPLAVRCKAIAFHLAGTVLDVAMLDPRNLACQDEIAFACGKRIRVHVATEVRIAEALDRVYGQEPDSRLAALVDQLNRSRYLWKGEGPTADGEGREAAGGEPPGAPEIQIPEWVDPVGELFPEQPLPASIRSAFSLRTASPAPAPGSPREPLLGTEPDLLPEEGPGEMPAASSPPSEPSAETPSSGSRRTVRREPPPTSIKLSPEELRRLYPEASSTGAPGGRPTLDTATAADLFKRTAKALETVRDRDQVGHILLDLLSTLFDRAALFLVRSTHVEGWMGTGGGLDPQRLENLVLSLGVPSVFLNLKAGSPFHLGPLTPVPAHRDLAGCWGGALPAGSLLVPVHLQDRLVAVLYGDRGERPLTDLPLGRFQELARQAAAAFESCIVLKKQSASELGGS